MYFINVEYDSFNRSRNNRQTLEKTSTARIDRAIPICNEHRRQLV